MTTTVRYARAWRSWRVDERSARDPLVALTASLDSLPLNEGRLIDLGCGDGSLLPMLIERGLSAENYVGLDANAELLQASRESDCPGARFELWDARRKGDVDRLCLAAFAADTYCASRLLCNLDDVSCSYLLRTLARCGEGSDFAFLDPIDQVDDRGWHSGGDEPTPSKSLEDLLRSHQVDEAFRGAIAHRYSRTPDQYAAVLDRLGARDVTRIDLRRDSGESEPTHAILRGRFRAGNP